MAGGVIVIDESTDHGVAGALRSAASPRRSGSAPSGLGGVLAEEAPSGGNEAVVCMHGHHGSARDREPVLAHAVGAATAVVQRQRPARPPGTRGGGGCV